MDSPDVNDMDLDRALYVVSANAKFNPDKWPETMEAVRVVDSFAQQRKSARQPVEKLQQAIKIISDIVADAPPCTCSEAYKSRGLIAPDCCRCNGPDLTEAEAWLGDLKRGW